MSSNCSSICPDWNGGKGKFTCSGCPEWLAPRGSKLGALSGRHCLRLDKEHLENLTNPEGELKTIFSVLPLMDERCATMLLQSTLLRMKNTEIALYHSISPTHVARLLKRALEEVRELL